MDYDEHQKVISVADRLHNTEPSKQEILDQLSTLYQDGKITGMENLAEKLELNVNLNND